MRRPDVFTLDYSHPLAQGLVFAGMCEHDSTLYRNDIAAEGGPAFRCDPTIGRCFWDFDGTNDRLVIPSAPHLQFGAGGDGPFTVCAWVYMRSSVSFRIFSKFSGESEKYEWSLNTTNSSILNFRCYQSVYRYIGRSAGSVLSLVGSWAHIVGLYRGGLSASNIEIYINGIRSDIDDSSAGVYNGMGSTDQPLYIGYRDSSVYWSNGLQADTLAFNRALSPSEIALLADRTDPMLGGMIVEERPVLYFDIGGSTEDALTASNLTVSAPVLGTPTLGQAHALIASGVTVEGPVLGAPALAQIHALTASGLAVEGPVLGAPTLAQIHALVAQNFTASSPVLGAPAAGQVHALTANNLTVSSPVLGTPVLTENAADVDALMADNLVAGSPVLGTPALTQVHVLGSDGLVTGSPVVGSPTITQIHALTALGLTVGTPVLGTPALNGSDIVLISADEIGRRAVLQARNYTATLAARNYTARL